MTHGRADEWLQQHSGWGQLVFALLAVAVQAVWNYAQLNAQAQQLAYQVAEQREFNRQMVTRLDKISENATNMAVSTARLAEQVATNQHDTDRRIDRLERTQDGHK